MPSNVSLSGPLFNGRALKALEQAVPAILKAVSKESASRAREYLNTSTEGGITGKAERSVTYTDHSVIMVSGKYTMPIVVDDPKTDYVVTTSLASYGPWLEGTGSRNLTTRFKGYHSFQMASQIMQVFAQPVADNAIQPYILRMQ